jgi:hypothetical protein
MFNRHIVVTMTVAFVLGLLLGQLLIHLILRLNGL